MIPNVKLSASDIFERLNVRLNEKFEIIGYGNNPHQIVRKDGYFELIDCSEKAVGMNILQEIMLQPHLVKRINKNNDWVTSYWGVVGDYWNKEINNDKNRKVYNVGGFVPSYNYPKVKKIIYNFKNPEKPATIVFWSDSTKTVVRCSKEEFNKEAGLAQCFLKKCLDCSRKDIKKLIDSADIQE